MTQNFAVGIGPAIGVDVRNRQRCRFRSRRSSGLIPEAGRIIPGVRTPGSSIRRFERRRCASQLKLFRRSVDETELRCWDRSCNRRRCSKSIAISIPMPIAEIFRNTTPKGCNSSARGANPGECSDDGVSTLKGLHRILAAWAHHHLPCAQPWFHFLSRSTSPKDNCV